MTHDHPEAAEYAAAAPELVAAANGGGAMPVPQILQILRDELKACQDTGRGPRRVTLGLHAAESIIHHLRTVSP